VVEHQEEVIKVNEHEVEMENPHLDLKVVKHLFTDYSQREVSSTCTSSSVELYLCCSAHTEE
jgi:hypothetical protein